MPTGYQPLSGLFLDCSSEIMFEKGLVLRSYLTGKLVGHLLATVTGFKQRILDQHYKSSLQQLVRKKIETGVLRVPIIVASLAL